MGDFPIKTKISIWSKKQLINIKPVVSSSIDFKIMLKFNIHSNCFEDLQSIVSYLKDREQKTTWRGVWTGKNWTSAYIECTKNQQKYLAILHPSVKWEKVDENL